MSSYPLSLLFRTDFLSSSFGHLPVGGLLIIGQHKWGASLILYLIAQVVLVSATLPGEVLEMTKKFMTEPLRVLVKRDELTLEVRHI